MKELRMVMAALCLLLTPYILQATHNRGGEIQFKQIASNTVEASVITYTKSSSAPADRDSITICWGDGQCDRLLRVNGPIGPGGVGTGELIYADIRKNIYTGIHEYAAPGRYTISMSDPNRNGGILNVNFPNSDQVLFHIESKVNVLESGWENNHSPILLEDPIDIGIQGQPFVHVPNAFDIDDDSVTYQLVVPLQGIDEEVPAYQFPDMINAGPANNLTLDEATGFLRWDAPQRTGEYNLAIRITTYRNGELWDDMIRDMQIMVIEGLNTPPVIELSETSTEIIEVAVGQIIVVDLETEDPQVDQDITISSSSGLYDFFENTAAFTSQTTTNTGTGQFEWEVNEEHIRQQAYQVVFKVKDTFDINGLASFRVLRYKVVEEMTNTTEENAQLNWLLFPNPATKELTISFKESMLPVSYTVLDIRGRKMLSGVVAGMKEKLSLSRLPSGIYLFKLGKDVRRFIVR